MLRHLRVTYVHLMKYLNKYLNEGKKVLYMAGSSKGSGTYQTAILAKNDIEVMIYIFLILII